MDIGDRIKQRRLEVRLTQEELARAVHSTKQTIYKYENKIVTNIPFDKLVAIADALHVHPAYLMGWENGQNDVRFPDNPSISLPIIGEVAAGFGHEAIEEETGDYEQIPVSWLHGRPKEDFFVLRVKGASMYPAYQEGDRVLVRRKSSVESGTVAVVLYDATEATLKKVKYKPGEDWMDLIPLNPEYAPRRVENHALEQCRILGEAIRLIRVIK